MFSAFQHLSESIASVMREQASQALKWAVVAFAAGIVIYFSLPFEPVLSGTGFLVLASLTLAVLIKRHPILKRVLIFLSLVFFGLFWASFNTERNDTIMLKKSLSPREVVGVIEEIEFLKTGQRITLNQVQIADVLPEETPNKVRLSMRAKKLIKMRVGMKISLKAGLLPPMGPILQGGFDFARYFYFRHIGAVGYGLNPVTILENAPPQGFTAFWQDLRFSLSSNIRSHLNPDHAAIATGLITGDDAGISPDLYEDLRAANLLHIIAISGSHMVVIAGVAFFMIRLLLLGIPGFGLSIGAKKLAAFLTLIAISAYLLVTGIEISALRAYVMMCFILLAVLIGRDVQPMRSLMLTAAIMLLYDPSDLLEPGFQLSFAATMAMIAVAEPALIRFFNRQSSSLIQNWLYTLPWVMLISVVAEWVTAPLVLYMFNQFAPYGMLSNMLAGPVVSMLIMPAVALYFLLVPIGFESLAMAVLDEGIGLLLAIAKLVADWPGSLQFVSSQPALGIVIYGFALVFLCLWKGRLRWMALPVMILSTFSFILREPPDLVVSQDMRHVAIRTDKGLELAQGRNYAMVPEMLAHATGHEKFPHAKPSNNFQCEGKGRARRCVVNISDKTILLDFTWDKSGAVCELAAQQSASILITNAYGVYCRDVPGLFVVNPYDRRRYGAYSWWFDRENPLKTTRLVQGERVWSTLRTGKTKRRD